MNKVSAEGEVEVLQGDFFFDGKTYVFRLSGTLLSGIGETPTAAFEDLMRVEAKTAPLSSRMRELARDQQGEKVRAEIIRMAMIGLIVFGVVGGSLAASAALAPKVIADIGSLAAGKVINSIDNMTPEREAALATRLRRINGLVSAPAGEAKCPEISSAAKP